MANGRVGRKQVHKSRQERQKEIIATALILENEGKEITAAAICRRMGVSVSAHFREMIEDIVLYRYFDVRTKRHWNGWLKTVYVINHEWLKECAGDWYIRTLCEHDLTVRMF